MVFQDNKFTISLFLRATVRPTFDAAGEGRRVTKREDDMFIFQRPFQAVIAALAVALLMAYAATACDGTLSAGAARSSNSPACAAGAPCGIVRAGS
jgi:hypothetical protein